VGNTALARIILNQKSNAPVSFPTEALDFFSLRFLP
jgi:hypothetical protein